MKVYTLYDRKAGEYGSLVLGTNDEFVIRALREVKGSDTLQARYPEDFELVEVGEFDQESGKLVGAPVRTVATLAAIFGHGS